MPRPPFPRSLSQFQAWFATEEACVRYLIDCRWPDGYRCPRCVHDQAYELATRALLQCRHCAYQASVTAGTVLHGSRLPWVPWFWAAYLVATYTPGISAVQLQRQAGIRRYETAWAVRRGYDRRPTTQGAPENAARLLPRVPRAFSNLKTWLTGTHHAVGREHLPHYLNEVVYRLNRHRTPMAAFQTLLGLAGQHSPTCYMTGGSRTHPIADVHRLQHRVLADPFGPPAGALAARLPRRLGPQIRGLQQRTRAPRQQHRNQPQPLVHQGTSMAAPRPVRRFIHEGRS